MLTKTKFIRSADGTYTNTQPIQEFSYDRCIDKRNAIDEQFYADRQVIVRDLFRTLLLPLLEKVKVTRKTIRVLDVGCGDGVMLEALNFIRHERKWKIELTGLDVDAYAMRHIRFRANKVVASATKMPFSNDAFDIVLSAQTIEHLTAPDAAAMLKECYRVLKPGGVFYIETPNPESFLARVMGKNWYMYIDLHLTLFPPSTLGRQMREMGFTHIHAGSRLEIDQQMDESRDIARLLHLPLGGDLFWNAMPDKFKKKLIEKVTQTLDQGSITIATGSKDGALH